MTPFETTVQRVVRSIPRGKTFSYGQVALFANRPGGARSVVRALRTLEGLPWWRVIRSDGTLAPQVAVRQARHLKAEGVAVKGWRVPRESRLQREAPVRGRAPSRASAVTG